MVVCAEPESEVSVEGSHKIYSLRLNQTSSFFPPAKWFDG